MAECFPTWSRTVPPANSLEEFLADRRACLHYNTTLGEPTRPEWLGDVAPCCGDGFDSNPLLAAPGDRRRAATMTGEIRDGRGFHPAASFIGTD